MKKISNINNIFLVLIPFLYFLSLVFRSSIDSDLLKILLASFHFFLAIPYALFVIFHKKETSNLSDFLINTLTIITFCIVPLVYFSNTYLKITMSQISFILIYVSFIVIVKAFLTKNANFYSISAKRTKEILVKNYPFLIALLVYFLIHLISFRFYNFIPEWDSYGDLISINRILTSGFTDITYRPFFPTIIALLSSITNISPYHIFSIIFTIIQSSILIVTYKFLKIYKVKNKILQLFFLLGIISIPVLSMEIDTTRPQNVFLIFFPIYIYFLHDFLVKKKSSSLILASLIAIFGQIYHEFFIFLLFFHFIIFCFLGYKKFIRKKLTLRKIFLLIVIVISSVSFIPIFAYKIPTVAYILSTMKSAFQRMLDLEKWRFWFIDSYSNSSELLQVGWSGISGAMKYYAYYASPFILMLIFLIAILLLSRNSFTPLKNKLFAIAFPLFAVFFFFAEITPRLNYHFLPERYWIFIDITLIFIAIPILRYFEEKPRIAKKFLVVVILCATVGFSGIIYIAHGKKALTSRLEYKAAEWIKKNTPPNSVFISQAANYPMIKYFSNREILCPTESFFLEAEIEKEVQPEKVLEKIEKAKNEIIGQMRRDFDAYIFEIIRFDEFEMKLRENKRRLEDYQLTLEKQLPKISNPAYILYSTDKFNTIYAQRSWWQRSNFYGANLEKFDRNFKLIYQNEAVKIWQMK